MINLTNTAAALEVVLSGAVATNALPCTAEYIDIDSTSQAVVAVGQSDGAATGTGTLTLVGSPAAGRTRTIKSVTIFNADTTGAIATVRLNNGTTTRIMVKPLLAVGDTLMGMAND